MGSSLSAIELAQACETQHGPSALAGQVVIITGANSGIGLGILKAIAPLGAKIFVAGRNKDKCDAVIERVKADSENADINFLQVDFSSFESVKKAVEEFKSLNLPIHYLFNNAGGVFHNYAETADGHEATLQANHLGPALFTELLVDRLAEASGARVIFTSSALHTLHYKGVLNVDDICRRENYSTWTAYGTTKLLQILYANECQRVWGESKKISMFSFHPGWVSSNIGSDNQMMKIVLTLTTPMQRSADQGASTAIYCALSDEALQFPGEFFTDNAHVALSPEVLNPDVCKRVRDMTLTWIGLAEVEAKAEI